MKEFDGKILLVDSNIGHELFAPSEGIYHGNRNVSRKILKTKVLSVFDIKAPSPKCFARTVIVSRVVSNL